MQTKQNAIRWNLKFELVYNALKIEKKSRTKCQNVERGSIGSIILNEVSIELKLSAVHTIHFKSKFNWFCFSTTLTEVNFRARFQF